MTAQIKCDRCGVTVDTASATGWVATGWLQKDMCPVCADDFRIWASAGPIAPTPKP
jgi:hypothetical protein